MGEALRAGANRMSVARLIRLAAIGFGLAFGIYFVLPSPYRDAPLWPVWAPLVVAFTTAAGAVFGYGLDRWADLSESHKVRVSNVAARIASIMIGSLLVLLGSTQLPAPVRASWRHVLLISILLMGGTPAAGAMEGTRLVARNKSVRGAKGEQVAELVKLRQLLRGLLAAVGSLVALSTLAIGAALTLERSLTAGSGQGAATTLPPQFVLVFGGTGSLLVALFYVPAATALRDRGKGLCDDLFPLEQANEASAILNAAEGRNKLQGLLGMEHGVVADLQTGLAILGPLLASAAAAFLSP